MIVYSREYIVGGLISMSHSPVLVVYAASKGKEIFIIGSPDIKEYADAPGLVQSDFGIANRRRNLLINEDTIQILANEDGNCRVWITSSRREELDKSNLVEWLVKQGLEIAKQKGWTIGQPTNDPLLLDGLFGEYGPSMAESVYEKPWLT
jgi:hypothetical protein